MQPHREDAACRQPSLGLGTKPHNSKEPDSQRRCSTYPACAQVLSVLLLLLSSTVIVKSSQMLSQ